MVDWSGGYRRRAGKQDCIWIAHGPRYNCRANNGEPTLQEAEHIIRSQLQPIVGSKKGRVLLCADFGYGYPAGVRVVASEVGLRRVTALAYRLAAPN